MVFKAFSIYDGKAKAFGVPFFMSQNGQAIRAFSDLVNDENTTVSKHPGDYNLYIVGSYDDEIGEFTNQSPVTLLGNGLEYKPNYKSNALLEEAKEKINA